MKNEKTIKSYPPPEKLSYPHKFRVWAFALLFVFVFALAGCTDSTTPKTATFEETVDDIRWEVTYNTETRDVVSIRVPYLLANEDVASPFYRFMVSYRGGNTLVVQCIKLEGVSLGNDLFKITQTVMYVASGSRADWEIIKETFPTCTYSESSYDVTDYETDETATVTTGDITFAGTVTTYEQKIVFSVPNPAEVA